MNELALLGDFKETLEHYSIAPRGKQILNETSLVLLLAATSTGRNTVIRELVKTGNFHFIVSDTTRKPRVNDGILEQNGLEYWFKSEQDFLNDLQKGLYLEAEVIHDQQVSGISFLELQRAKDEHKIAITDIDLKGCQTVVAAKPDTVAILLIPPSFEEWQNRIRRRGIMETTELRRRSETALRIFEAGLTGDYFKLIVSDNVERSSRLISMYASGHAVDQNEQSRGQHILKELHARTTAWLIALK